MRFLRQCEDFTLIALNEYTEIELEDFGVLKNLKKLNIGSNFLLDYDWDRILTLNAIITILVSKEYKKDAMNAIEYFREAKTNVQIGDLKSEVKAISGNWIRE